MPLPNSPSSFRFDFTCGPQLQLGTSAAITATHPAITAAHPAPTCRQKKNAKKAAQKAAKKAEATAAHPAPTLRQQKKAQRAAKKAEATATPDDPPPPTPDDIAAPHPPPAAPHHSPATPDETPPAAPHPHPATPHTPPAAPHSAPHPHPATADDPPHAAPHSPLAAPNPPPAAAPDHSATAAPNSFWVPSPSQWSSEDETCPAVDSDGGSTPHQAPFTLHITPGTSPVASGTSRDVVLKRFNLDADVVRSAADAPNQGVVSRRSLMSALKTSGGELRRTVNALVERQTATEERLEAAEERLEAAEEQLKAAEKEKQAAEKQRKAAEKQVAALGQQWLQDQLPIIATDIITRGLFPPTQSEPSDKVLRHRQYNFVSTLVSAMQAETEVGNTTQLSILKQQYQGGHRAGTANIDRDTLVVIAACDRLFDLRNSSCAYFDTVKRLEQKITDARTLLAAHPDMRHSQPMAVALVKHYNL